MGLNSEELFNAGMKGLVEVGRRFDPKRRFKFVAYAIWWIRQVILIALRDWGNDVGKQVYQQTVAHAAKIKELNIILENGQLPVEIADTFQLL